MKKAKYSVGDKVYHTTKQKYGTVVEEGFWDDDSEYRYYVNHSGYTWSVPERCLRFKPNHQNWGKPT